MSEVVIHNGQKLKQKCSSIQDTDNPAQTGKWKEDSEQNKSLLNGAFGLLAQNHLKKVALKSFLSSSEIA